MVKKIIIFITCGIIFIGISGGILIFIVNQNLPDPALIGNHQISQSTKIYDRAKETLLYEIYGEEKRTIIPFEKIPEHVKQTTLTIEDVNFYNHPAFDWRSIIRAFFVNLLKGRIAQGGSTITQQLAKNAFLTPEKTLIRKIKELILAFQLEKHYSKDEIFNLYLNQIPYGSNAYGIEAASQTYFKKSAQDLNIAEAALLAALPKAPSYYSPWGSHADELIARKDYILDKMTDYGFIDKQEKEQAKKFKFIFASPNTGIKAPHFVIAIQDYLNNKYGEDFIRTAGLEVTTTLDWDLQQAAEKIVLNNALKNEELYQGKNAALIAQDATNGQILAMVGSRNYFDEEIDGNFNVATQGLRQPGSAIKPFVYLTAFKKGFTPQTVLFDVPTEFVPNNPNCPTKVDFSKDIDESSHNCYHPQNFDSKFRGPVSFRQALGQSLNVPSVKVLYLAGIDNVLKTVKDFGIDTLTERSRYGLSLVLGGGEIKLIELVNTYATLAQNGLKHKQSLILRIKDSENKILEEYKDQTQQVVESQYPRLVNDILTDIETRSGLFTNSLSLTVFDDHQVALKTGTTNDYRDAWAFGYTPSLVVGVWAGNNDNQPMQKHGSSILAAVPMWSEFMQHVLVNRPTETFEKPDLVSMENSVLNGYYPEIHSILYYLNKESPQFLNWEESVLEWAKNHPQEITELNINPNSATILNLISPTNGAFITDNKIEINAQIKSDEKISKIEISLNEKVLSSQELDFGSDFRYQKTLSIKDPQLQNMLKVAIWDSRNNKTEKELIIYK